MKSCIVPIIVTPKAEVGYNVMATNKKNYSVSLMTRCWYEDCEERPSFDELAANLKLEKVLSTMVGYVELNIELVAITEDEHSKQLILS